jgi:PAS domain S-box-containing protein
MDYQIRRLNGEEISTYPLRIIHKNGSTRWFEHSGILITWNGRPATLSFLNEITERKRAEEALKESEEKYRELFENESDAVMIFDAETFVFEDANKATFDLYGYSPEEFLKLNVEDISAEKEKTRVAVQKVLNDEPESKRVALRYFRKKDGTVFPGEISAGTFIAGGRKKIIGSVRDITERKRIEEALRQNEKRFQKIVESAPFGYYRLGKDGRYQYVNPEWESMHGSSGGEIIGKSVEVTEADDNKARVLEYFYRALDGQTIKAEFKHILKDGSYGYHELTIQPVYQNKEIVAVEGFISDLTERKRNEDLVRNLSHLLMQAQERERQMISYELHDRIAQNLSTLKIECTMLSETQPAIIHVLEDKIVRMSKLIELTITSVRDLAYNLRPPGLNDMSIVKAVEIYCEEFSESSGLDIDFQSTGMHALKFNYDMKLHLYRLVQEGLHNIRKHAEAGRAAIRMIGASPNIILRIEDNGKGFDIKERERSLDNRKRMGLRSMRERVNLLGGQMTIRSRPMTGTKIFIKFPFKEKDSDSQKTHINH